MMNAKPLLIFAALIGAAGHAAAVQTSVRVEPENLKGPRELVETTKATVIRDYLESWQSFSKALEANRPDLLNLDFTGTSKDKLTEAIGQQAAAGIRTRYRDLSHDLQIVFYSPEGLSVELTDKVDYEVQVIDHDKVTTAQHVTARYIVVMTPAEIRWRVRVFQAVPN